jgi:hypothetical protein
MSRRAAVRLCPASGALRATAAALGLAALVGQAGAQAVRVDALGCKRGVHVQAEGAPLEDVLKGLADSLRFRLTVEATLDSRVRIDATEQADELIGRLLVAENFMVTRARDPGCPGRSRIVRVWVLAGPPKTAAQAVQSISRVPITPEARAQDELYQRAHGMLPE